jgi:hypothetical protein
MPTVMAIEGNKIAPGPLDTYLAHNCYDGQQTDEPVSSDRPNNLFNPVPGDHGAHGIFGNRSYTSSQQLWQTTHRSKWIPAVSLGLATLGCVLLLGGRR